VLWQSNPQIGHWLKAHPHVAGFAGLETYFEQELLGILQAQNSSYMAWQVGVIPTGVPLLLTFYFLILT
tara:strand:+ start:1074 stop:1280 length:207 start_codon:yes stop_codon:yes gene_type:complete